jgi:heme A synthase
LKPGPVLFRVTGAVLGLQLVLGGLLTFGFISAFAHIVVGLVLFGLAIVNMVVWLRSKPVIRPLRAISVVIVLLLLLQIALGFSTLSSGSQVVAFFHFLVALGIFGATLAGTFMAMRFDRMSAGENLHAREGQSAQP